MTTATFTRKHLLGIRELEPTEITHLLDTAETFRDVSERPIKKVPTLRGRTVINLFLEPSTRTRTSFEIAAKRLSADAVNISGSASSTTKGETLLDTARNIDALRALGAQVRVAGPRTLLPVGLEAMGAVSYDRLEPALEGADVVMML